MSYQPSDILKNAINNNKLAHAYLFYGDKGVDVEKHTFDTIKMIIELSGKKINETSIDEINYYDLEVIKPNVEGNIIKESVDKTINKLFETSLEKGNIKILYIKDIDLGNKHSLNRLLKFIEEPVDNLIIFMNTNHINNVISTIKSRAQNIYIKRENIEQKAAQISFVNDKFRTLIANMYANKDQVKNIDLKLFEKTYDSTLLALEQSIKNKHLLKDKLFELWTKFNTNFVLNILQFFFYQVMMKINDSNPLFPNKNNLINEFKIKNINVFEIEKLIDKTKWAFDHYGNFNLQKIYFLNELEKHLN